MKPFSLTAMLLLALACAACNSDYQYKTAPVKGVLTCQGKPVPGVRVAFAPLPGEGRSEGMPGKTALGTTDDEGRFVLTTYERYDGAVVGTHVVSVIVEDLVDINGEVATNPHLPVIKQLLRPCLNSTAEVEVKAGNNDLAVELGK